MFILRFIERNEVDWVFLSIPSEEQHLLEDVLPQCGLQIARSVPCIASMNGFQPFPFWGDNVRALENTPGHPVYKNDPALNKTILEAESLAAEKIRGNAVGPLHCAKTALN